MDERRTQIDKTYLKVASTIASLSRAERLKVGAVIASNGVIISTGYNGTPRGTENCCETFLDRSSITKDDVIHAELNAVLNIVRSGYSNALIGSTIYLTDSPCAKCAALIKQVGITRVVYFKEYRVKVGIEYLEANGVKVEHYDSLD